MQHLIQNPGTPHHTTGAPSLQLTHNAIESTGVSQTRVYLVAQVTVGLFGQQESHHLRVALLSRQVEGGHALHRLRVRRGPVLQQTAGHLQLVLLGGDVQRGVAVLKQTGAPGACLQEC